MKHSRVLVVGGLGFIGVNLVEKLVQSGARTRILARDRANHDAHARAFAHGGVDIIEGDVRDRDIVATAVRGQDIVFNLSGQSGAVRSMEDPWSDLDVNCRGNLVLLEALREHNRDAKVVFAGSRLQYGHPDQVPVSEDAPQEALCLHAIHKQTVEKYLRLYRRLFGIRYTVARITNPYGPGQPAGRTAYGVINRLIHLAITNRTLSIYGDGRQLRDYIHVDDTVDALLALAGSDRADGGAFNVGSGEGTRLIDLAETVIEIAGGGRIEHVAWPALAEQVETGDFIADISRIERELGWRPTIALRDGLERTVAFYRAQAVS
ncbi:MAG TPA: NAD-dependent epimerase/dehydratase family protein [Vicinamibacterales bacterium]|nr:NAD-dependent epimerase/dehydratase family protein [Vicinamibacterales bacterium]